MQLWFTTKRTKWFLVPDAIGFPSGSTEIRNLTGETATVDDSQLHTFEVSEPEALSWAKQELGESLDELKQNIDEKLADWRRQLDEFNRLPMTQKSTVTPEAASVFFDFLKQLPGIFRESVSGEEEHVDSARKATADLARRFTEAGLEVDDRLKGFPERLAKIQKNGQPGKN